MSWAKCKFIKRVAEFQFRTDSDHIPDNTRGIYVLLKEAVKNKFDVVYVGMSAGLEAGMYSRLKAHRKSKRLKWTHFSLFEVHDNMTSAEVRELEGLIRHIYRKDSRANKLNVQLCYKPFHSPKILKNKLPKWD